MYPTKTGWQAIACLLITSSALFSQWNKNAGTNAPLSTSAAAQATSEYGPNVANNAIDGDENTMWQSKSPLPAEFISDLNQNILLGLPAVLQNTASNISNLTDGNNLSSAHFTTNTNGISHVRVNLPQPMKLSIITFRGEVLAGNIDVTIFEPNGDSSLIGQYTPTDNYGYAKFSTTKTVAAIKLSSTVNFLVSELGAIGPTLIEDLDIDLGSLQNIGWIHLRAYSSQSADSVVVFSSPNKTNWKKAATVNNDNYFTTPYKIRTPTNARYLKIRTFMKMQDYGRAEIREIRVYDQNGIYGTLPLSKPATRPLKQMLGVNGLWGWGTSAYSDQATSNQAANLFKRIGTHARNYHNLDWDVADPDITPDYSNMPGSLNQTWLDWDREYQTWQNAGLDVQASIQFLSTNLPAHIWNNPYQAAYNYGYAFANHFGPTNGNGLVTSMEVGNEPWDYDSTFYQNVLMGMASGAKAADPAMEVYSCALQSADPTAEATTNHKNYMGARLPAGSAQYLDGLNVHHYSYVTNEATGVRVATFPENPASTMRAIVGDIRFRDANMPGTKILMSEWGWDSDGAGEPCTHNECVTEEAQAIYAIRGLMMLDRLGVDRATWFFYGNLPFGSSIYTRSGLTGSKNTGFQPKTSFYAIEHLLKKMGDSYFLEVIAENEDTWAYLYGDSTGKPTHVVAWRPVDANDGGTHQLEIKRGYIADSAWVYDGLSNTPAQVSLPKNKNGEITLNLTASPILLKLDSSVVSSVSIDETPVTPNTMEVYPNPNAGQFSVKLYLKEGGTVNTRIYSMDRRTVLPLQPINANGGTTLSHFELAHLPPGAYLFEASKSDGSFAQRQRIIITP